MNEFMLREFVIAGAIVAICAIVHIGGLALLAQFLLDRSAQLETVNTVTRRAFVLMFVFGIVISLHLAQAVIWATFYHANSLFPDYETALYFSLKTYSTIGYGDVLLPRSWRLLGGIEGISGVLLCGVSAAFIFTVVNVLFQRKRKTLS